MAISKALGADQLPSLPPEYGPGGDPEMAFFAGAMFGYRDSARRMGEAMIYDGDFERWAELAGFSPEARMQLTKIYEEAYHG